MERKRLETPAQGRPVITVAGNRARLSRALRSRNHIDAAALTKPTLPEQPAAGGAS